jgi:hypothetical protein
MTDNIFAKYAGTAGTAAAMGVGFGVVLYKNGLAKPSVMRKQLSLESMTVVKSAVTALPAASLIAAVGYGMGWHGPILYPKMTVQTFDVVGGAFLGTGLHLVGATPETVLINAGSGKETAVWAILGEIAGAVVYGLIHPMIYGKSLEFDVRGTKTELSLDKDIISGVLNFEVLKVAIPLTALMAGGLYVLEELFPEETFRKTPAEKEAPVESMVLRRRWDPYCSALILAALQVPCLVMTGIGLSSSDSYMAIAGYIVSLFGKPNDYFKSIMSAPSTYIQMLFHSSLALGGFIASRFLMPKDKVKKKRNPLTMKQKLIAFLGGVTLIFGTRLTNIGTLRNTKIVCTSFTSIVLALGSGILASKLIPRNLLGDE